MSKSVGKVVGAAPATATATAKTLLTLADVADRYRVGVDHIRGLIRSGGLPAVNMSAKPNSRRPIFRVRLSDLEDFEAARQADKATARRIPSQHARYPRIV